MPLRHTDLISKLINRILNYKVVNKSNNKLICRSANEINEFLLVSCIDKRVDPINMVKVPVGKMYVVRNPGNMIPGFQFHGYNQISSEAGAIELAVKKAGIQDIVVCGHSDCKAMHYLLEKNTPDMPNVLVSPGPLDNWITKFTTDTWKKFFQWTKDPSEPILFQIKPESYPPNRVFISKDIELVDSLSQINTLQQVENIVKFPCLQEELNGDKLSIYTIWEDLRNGPTESYLYLFDPEQERFIKISDETSQTLIHDFEE